MSSIKPFGKFNTFQEMWKNSKSECATQNTNLSICPKYEASNNKHRVHKLRQSWELFMILPTKGAENIPPSSFGKFSTIQGMWEYVNNININNLPLNYGLAIFQEGCQPLWEDEKNKSGARMMVSVKNSEQESINSFFIEASMLLFGGSLGTEDITGIIYAKRDKYTRIAIWMSDYSNLVLAKKVGLQFKAFLPNDKFEFQKHDSNDYYNYLLVL